jgi:nitrate/TMAO reductase-like tetraheme cytochrome c subunit
VCSYECVFLTLFGGLAYQIQHTKVVHYKESSCHVLEAKIKTTRCRKYSQECYRSEWRVQYNRPEKLEGHFLTFDQTNLSSELNRYAVSDYRSCGERRDFIAMYSRSANPIVAGMTVEIRPQLNRTDQTNVCVRVSYWRVSFDCH